MIWKCQDQIIFEGHFYRKEKIYNNLEYAYCDILIVNTSHFLRFLNIWKILLTCLNNALLS